VGPISLDQANSNPTNPYPLLISPSHDFVSPLLTTPASSPDIEALLAAAKSGDGMDLSADRQARLDLLGKVEALHYQLDNPSDAMFRQIMNIRYLSQPPLLWP
jgi:hypothetical protein